MKFLLVFVFGCRCLWSEDYGDLRNLDRSHTKTHFSAQKYRSLSDWETRRASLRKQILAASGLLPAPPKTPLQARRFEPVVHGRIVIEKVVFEPLPGLFVAGNLYRPQVQRSRAPGILLPHGHWKHGRIHDAPDYSVPALAANLAHQGYVVFAYDMFGYNDTRQLKHEFGDTPEEQLWAFGPLGLQLWNGIRALDFLESLPEVDPRRLAVTGASGGGTHTMLLGAVDLRVRVAIPVDMVSATFQGDDACEMAPGLRVGTNNMEIAAMMAPRHLFLVSSTKDWTKNTPQEEFPAVQAIYRLYGRSERVSQHQVDAPHNYNRESREAVYRYLDRELRSWRGRRTGLVELPLTPPHLEQLLVGSSLSSGPIIGATQLFAQWKQTARAQTAAMSSEELRGVLLSVFGVRWPESVEVHQAGEHTLLSGGERGDRVPVLWQPKPGDAVTVMVGEGTRRLAAAEGSLLRVHVFQTGAAATSRSGLRRDHLTFHRSDDAERVQDILTSLAYVHASGPVAVRLVCDERAGLWCLAAAALAPIPVALVTPPAERAESEEALQKNLFVPGLQRVGGLEGLRRLTHRPR